MPTEAADDEAGEEAPRSRRPGKKAMRVLVVGVIILVAIVMGWMGSAPVPDRTPSYVLENAASLLGDQVRVRGNVTDWDWENRTFYLSDREGTLAAEYSIAPPHQMEIGKEAIVIGVVRSGGLGYYVEVEEVIVGHPK